MNLTTKEAIAMGILKVPTGRIKVNGMNKWEAEYSRRLELLKHTGTIVWFAYEAVKFRLAQKTFYTPDFLVMRSSGAFELHEVKGFMRDDAAIKIKVLAEHAPMRIVLVQRHKGQWTYQNVPGAVDRITMEDRKC